jgi:hypothetical protein
MPTATNAVRWTLRRIRAALKCPKPTGALSRLYAYESGHLAIREPVLPVERQLLSHIADNADLLDVPATKLEYGRPVRWLLVPLPDALLDRLAEFGANLEDLEPDHDGEADSDREPDEDDEADGIEERADVRPESMDRCGFPYHEGPDIVVTAEQRERYSYSTDRRTLAQARAFVHAHNSAGR